LERIVESIEIRPGLQRLVQFDVVMHGAVEHRLAVFVLADLQ
jgi:hypothetical protein